MNEYTCIYLGQKNPYTGSTLYSLLRHMDPRDFALGPKNGFLVIENPGAYASTFSGA